VGWEVAPRLGEAPGPAKREGETARRGAPQRAAYRRKKHSAQGGGQTRCKGIGSFYTRIGERGMG
jgi:hypothetical protein